MLVKLKNYVDDFVEIIQIIMINVVSLFTFLVGSFSAIYSSYYLFIEFEPERVVVALILSVAYIHINKSYRGG